MKKNILFCLALGLAACNRAPEPVYYDDYAYDANYEFVGAPAQQVAAAQENACADGSCARIAYSTPNGNDLKLETNNTVLHVVGAPGQQYAYYVWGGGRDTDTDPDLIIEQGTAAVLVEQ